MMAGAILPVFNTASPPPAPAQPPASNTDTDAWASAMTATQAAPQSSSSIPPVNAGSTQAKPVPADSGETASATTSSTATTATALAASQNSSVPNGDAAPSTHHKKQNDADSGAAASLAGMMLSFAGGANLPSQPARPDGHKPAGDNSSATTLAAGGPAAHMAGGDHAAAAAEKDVKDSATPSDTKAAISGSEQAASTPAAGAKDKSAKSPSEEDISAFSLQTASSNPLPSAGKLSMSGPDTGSSAVANTLAPTDGKADFRHTGKTETAKSSSSQTQPISAQPAQAAAATGQTTAQSVQTTPQGSASAVAPAATAVSTAHATVSRSNGTDTVSQSLATTIADASSVAPSALAATVTAMHRGGQNSTTLRLDPPDLGSLSVHVSLGEAGSVNVAFVSTTPQAAQLLHAGMDSFRQSMASAGLTLGQAEVSGGGGQSAGQGQPDQQGRFSGSGQTSAIPSAGASDSVTNNGVRAYA